MRVHLAIRQGETFVLHGEMHIYAALTVLARLAKEVPVYLDDQLFRAADAVTHLAMGWSE